ncbi:hypothetical protein AAG906_005788 [Vitis piasezkii]
MPFFMGRNAPTPRNVVDVERVASHVPKTRRLPRYSMLLLERIMGGFSLLEYYKSSAFGHFRLQGLCGLARRFVGTPKPQDLVPHGHILAIASGMAKRFVGIPKPLSSCGMVECFVGTHRLLMVVWRVLYKHSWP